MNGARGSSPSSLSSAETTEASADRSSQKDGVLGHAFVDHAWMGHALSDGHTRKKERNSWTRAEDEVILAGVSELGHKWYAIARRLPGRTDHAIRNRWSRLQSIIAQQEMHNLNDNIARYSATASPHLHVADANHNPQVSTVEPKLVSTLTEVSQSTSHMSSDRVYAPLATHTQPVPQQLVMHHYTAPRQSQGFEKLAS